MMSAKGDIILLYADHFDEDYKPDDISWHAEVQQVKKLKKKVKQLQNGHTIAKLRERIMSMKQKAMLKAGNQKVKLELKRSQNLDIQSLLHAAIDEAGKHAHHMTAEMHRKRVRAAVMAVTQLVGAADRKKGKEIADEAMQDIYTPMRPISPGDKKYVSKLESQNKRLRAKLQRYEAAGKIPVKKGPVELERAAIRRAGTRGGGRLSSKQQTLMGKLDNLIKLDNLPGANRKVSESSAKTMPPAAELGEVQQLPSSELGEAQRRQKGRQEEEFTNRVDDQLHHAAEVAGVRNVDDEVGELKKGAFLVPSLERGE